MTREAVVLFVFAAVAVEAAAGGCDRTKIELQPQEWTCARAGDVMRDQFVGTTGAVVPMPHRECVEWKRL